MAQQTQRKYTYFNTKRIFCHESAMQLGAFANEFDEITPFISLSPRIADVGDKPKNGEKVYNYDENTWIPISVNQLLRIKEVINYMAANPKARVSESKLGNVFAYNVVRGEYCENPIEDAVYLLFENSDTKNSIGFLFENVPFTVNLDNGTDDGNNETLSFDQNLRIFNTWVDAVVEYCLVPHPEFRIAKLLASSGNRNPSAHGASTASNGFRKNAPKQEKPAEEPTYSAEEGDMPF